MPIVWTPPESELGLGSVTLPSPPSRPLSRQAYLNALAQRIQDLVDDLPPNQASQLLQVVHEQENLNPSNLSLVGELLAENSDQLAAKAYRGVQFPVPPSQVKHNPNGLGDENNLESYLSKIYQPPL